MRCAAHIEADYVEPPFGNDRARRSARKNKSLQEKISSPCNHKKIDQCALRLCPQVDDGLAMIKITQQRSTDKTTDRFEIETATVLALFIAEAVKIEGMPQMPTKNIHGHAYHKYGPWYLYLPSEKAEEFVDEVGFLSLEVTDAKNMAHQIDLDLSRHQFGTIMEGKVSEAQLDLESVHILIVIPAGPLVALLTKDILKMAWQQHGFVVMKCNQEVVKINGKSLKKNGLLNRFHFNLKHKDFELVCAPWPPSLRLSLQGTQQYLDYTMFAHPELSGNVCLKYCHRQTRKMVEWMGPRDGFYKICPGNCDLTNIGKKQAPASRGEGTAETMLKDKIAKDKEDNAQTECQNFAGGQCLSIGRGKECKFLHAADPGTIQCRITNKKYCNPAKCKYAHGMPPPPNLGESLLAINSMAGSSSDHMEDHNTGAASEGDLCKWKHMFIHKPRLNFRKGKWYSCPTSILVSPTDPTMTKPYTTDIWDSTLGFPGEGHLRLLGHECEWTQRP